MEWRRGLGRLPADATTAAVERAMPAGLCRGGSGEESSSGLRWQQQVHGAEQGTAADDLRQRRSGL